MRSEGRGPISKRYVPQTTYSISDRDDSDDSQVDFLSPAQVC